MSIPYYPYPMSYYSASQGPINPDIGQRYFESSMFHENQDVSNNYYPYMDNYYSPINNQFNFNYPTFDNAIIPYGRLSRPSSYHSFEFPTKVSSYSLPDYNSPLTHPTIPLNSDTNIPYSTSTNQVPTLLNQRFISVNQSVASSSTSVHTQSVLSEHDPMEINPNINVHKLPRQTTKNYETDYTTDLIIFGLKRFLNNEVEDKLNSPLFSIKLLLYIYIYIQTDEYLSKHTIDWKTIQTHFPELSTKNTSYFYQHLLSLVSNKAPPLQEEVVYIQREIKNGKTQMVIRADLEVACGFIRGPSFVKNVMDSLRKNGLINKEIVTRGHGRGNKDSLSSSDDSFSTKNISKGKKNNKQSNKGFIQELDEKQMKLYYYRRVYTNSFESHFRSIFKRFTTKQDTLEVTSKKLLELARSSYNEKISSTLEITSSSSSKETSTTKDIMKSQTSSRDILNKDQNTSILINSTSSNVVAPSHSNNTSLSGPTTIYSPLPMSAISPSLKPSFENNPLLVNSLYYSSMKGISPALQRLPSYSHSMNYRQEDYYDHTSKGNELNSTPDILNRGDSMKSNDSITCYKYQLTKKDSIKDSLIPSGKPTSMSVNSFFGKDAHYQLSISTPSNTSTSSSLYPIHLASVTLTNDSSSRTPSIIDHEHEHLYDGQEHEHEHGQEHEHEHEHEQDNEHEHEHEHEHDNEHDTMDIEGPTDMISISSPSMNPIDNSKNCISKLSNRLPDLVPINTNTTLNTVNPNVSIPISSSVDCSVPITNCNCLSSCSSSSSSSIVDTPQTNLSACIDTECVHASVCSIPTSLNEKNETIEHTPLDSLPYTPDTEGNSLIMSMEIDPLLPSESFPLNTTNDILPSSTIPTQTMSPFHYSEETDSEDECCSCRLFSGKQLKGRHCMCCRYRRIAKFSEIQLPHRHSDHKQEEKPKISAQTPTNTVLYQRPSSPIRNPSESSLSQQNSDTENGSIQILSSSSIPNRFNIKTPLVLRSILKREA